MPARAIRQTHGSPTPCRVTGTHTLGKVGLRLAADKTRVVDIDEGFDFLGFHIQRHRQKGSNRLLIYTYPSRKSLATIRRKVSTATDRQTTGLPAKNLFIHLGQITRGWALYFSARILQPGVRTAATPPMVAGLALA
jgi:hypothetical protein